MSEGQNLVESAGRLVSGHTAGKQGQRWPEDFDPSARKAPGMRGKEHEMRKLIVASMVLGSLLVASSALAAEGSGSGLSLGLRTGYGMAMGDAAKDAKMSDGVKGQIPIWLDVGYKLNPSIYVGGYFSYGIGMLNKEKTGCDQSGVSCSASDMRFGVDAHYHIMPEASFDPWVGLGVGYEIAGYKASAGGAEAKSSYKGLEYVNIQAGGDYKVAPNFGIGPFVTFSMGQYSSYKVTTPAGELSGDIPEKGMHQWLMIGIRGVYDLAM